MGSSWATDACGRRFFFERGEGLRPIYRDKAPRYGDSWHLVMENVHLFWRDHPGCHYGIAFLRVCAWCGGTGGLDGEASCARCEGSGLGPVARQAQAWAGTDLEDKVLVLQRAAEGWLQTYGDFLAAGWSVFGVEVPLAFPIPTPKSRRGETYAPVLPVVTRADGSRRLARAGEATKSLPEGWRLDWERVPAWGSVRIDALLVSPGGALWVGEWKSSGDPGGYLEGLQVDPQVTVYELAVEHAIGTGGLYLPGPGRLGWTRSEAPQLGGWIYDVTSSHLQRDLEVLKSGQFSLAANKLSSVPSWRMRASLNAAGVDPMTEAGKVADVPVTWNDRIAVAAARVDGKMYKRDNAASPQELRDAVLLEMFSTARIRAARYRASALATTQDQIRLAFPRTAVCRGPGSSCPFRGPCVADSPETRRWYTAPEDLPSDVIEDDGELDADDGGGEA